MYKRQVCIDEICHERAGEASGRLDHVRLETLVVGLVVERAILARVLSVGRKVEVGAVRDALELAPLAAGEAEAVLDVCGCLLYTSRCV